MPGSQQSFSGYSWVLSRTRYTSRALIQSADLLATHTGRLGTLLFKEIHSQRILNSYSHLAILNRGFISSTVKRPTKALSRLWSVPKSPDHHHTKPEIPDPWPDSKSRSTLGLRLPESTACRSIRIQDWTRGSGNVPPISGSFWILPETVS